MTDPIPFITPLYKRLVDWVFQKKPEKFRAYDDNSQLLESYLEGMHIGDIQLTGPEDYHEFTVDDVAEVYASHIGDLQIRLVGHNRPVVVSQETYDKIVIAKRKQ